jgi:hypothetical protein
MSIPDFPVRQFAHAGVSTPPPGTVVAPGGHATIRVYVPPAAGCF